MGDENKTGDETIMEIIEKEKKKGDKKIKTVDDIVKVPAFGGRAIEGNFDLEEIEESEPGAYLTKKDEYETKKRKR